MENVSWKDALERLKKGNANFVNDKLDGELNDSSRRQSLESGQSPYAIIVSCADSRVVPELAFDTGLGELFVIRVAGNVGNVSTNASIEYAVAHLGVKLVVVLGHESCGAVNAAIAGGDNGPNLNKLLSYIQPAINACPGGSPTDVIKENASKTIEKLLAESSIISEAAAKDLKLMPAYYNMGSGKVDFL